LHITFSDKTAAQTVHSEMSDLLSAAKRRHATLYTIEDFAETPNSFPKPSSALRLTVRRRAADISFITVF
jgi:hypothetical protein